MFERKQLTFAYAVSRTVSRIRLGREQKRGVLLEKWKEAFSSVLPITVIILVLCFLVTPVPVDAMLAFLMGSVLLVLGMGLFNLGTDLAMTRIGESVGSALTRSKKLWLILSVGFLVGVMVTVSEPDLTVLASQVPAVPDAVLILSVALGVGVFLVLALVRILFQIRMWILLLIAYGIVFLLTPFVPSTFLAVAFDAGGVTHDRPLHPCPGAWRRLHPLGQQGGERLLRSGLPVLHWAHSHGDAPWHSLSAR